MTVIRKGRPGGEYGAAQRSQQRGQRSAVRRHQAGTK